MVFESYLVRLVTSGADRDRCYVIRRSFSVIARDGIWRFAHGRPHWHHGLGEGDQDRCRHRDFTPKPQVGCTRHSFARLASSCALSSTSSFAAVAPCLASRIRRQPHRLSLGEPSMARLLVACQVIRYGFFIVRKYLSSFVIKGVSTPLTFYIHSRKQCDARCTHP